jgi:hypothetical protein
MPFMLDTLAKFLACPIVDGAGSANRLLPHTAFCACLYYLLQQLSMSLGGGCVCSS